MYKLHKSQYPHMQNALENTLYKSPVIGKRNQGQLI